MAYKMRLIKYTTNENEINGDNPYQEMFDEKDGKTHEIYGMWFKVVDIGIDGFDDIPYFYIELEEVQNEHLVKCRKITGKNTRLLKAIINELKEKSIEVKSIIPIFSLDEYDLREILSEDLGDANFKYLSKDKERIYDDNGRYFYSDDETYNYLIKVAYWKGKKIMTDNFVLKELEDMSFLLNDLLDVAESEDKE